VWSACAHKPRATCTPGCNAGHAMGLFQGKEKTLATLREAEGEAHSRAPHPPPTTMPKQAPSAPNIEGAPKEERY
jgi:hypothetical protein